MYPTNQESAVVQRYEAVNSRRCLVEMLKPYLKILNATYTTLAEISSTPPPPNLGRCSSGATWLVPWETVRGRGRGETPGGLRFLHVNKIA